MTKAVPTGITTADPSPRRHISTSGTIDRLSSPGIRSNVRKLRSETDKGKRVRSSGIAILRFLCMELSTTPRHSRSKEYDDSIAGKDRVAHKCRSVPPSPATLLSLVNPSFGTRESKQRAEH